MGLEADIENREGFIHFRVKGVFKHSEINSELIDVFGKMVESVKQYDCFRVLLDTRELDYEINVLERFKIGEYISKIWRKEFIEIACLRCADKTDDFTETVATNRGSVFKFFNNEKESIDWLKE